MKRKLRNEEVADFQHTDDRRLAELRQQILRWATDNLHVLNAATPVMPGGFVNRIAANWRLLLAIADAAGGDWPKKAREAAGVIANVKAAVQASTGVQLLGDIREVFSEQESAVFSKTLVGRLTADPKSRGVSSNTARRSRRSSLRTC